MLEIEKGHHIPNKYIPGSLSVEDKRRQKQALLRSRKQYKKGKYITRPKIKSFKSKKSGHVENARKLYGVENMNPTPLLARKTGCSQKALKKIINKGEGAYFSSGSRPSQTAHSWGYARLASAITGAKASQVDYHILKQGCTKKSMALKLANRTRKQGKK